MDLHGTPPRHIPVSTYRLQLNKHFTFADAESLLDYLRELGIGDCYASPIFQARSGSGHGYDVVNHEVINPELGGAEAFERFSAGLKARGLGLILDMVPNHMCISDSANRWWMDVLENGPASPYAHYFDIDWHPPRLGLSNRILLPVLGDQYGRMIEQQEVSLSYDPGGSFRTHYYESNLPLAPKSWIAILELVVEKLHADSEDQDPAVPEIQSVITALGHLPKRSETEPERVRERQREKEIVKRRLSDIVNGSPRVKAAIDEVLGDLNGRKDDPRSFDRLEAILNDQVYRLCFWRVAADEINYRRFFDISDLAAIRVEEPEVFQRTHSLVMKLVRDGVVNGLRIDHVDGLFDPRQYLLEVQRAANEGNGAGDPLYVIVEKILGVDEVLREGWATHGTTGYEALNRINGLFVSEGNQARFREIYSRFTNRRYVNRAASFRDILAASKKFIMHVSLASELMMLASRLDRIALQHRYSRDFTFESLRFALREVIASFPVYRSYIRLDQASIDPADRDLVERAVRDAKRANPSTSESVFDFIRGVLLLEEPPGLTDAQREERRLFVMRFQQLTSPVMAKGMEDTAFYRYFPLASLNEVGGDPERFGLSVAEFHRENQRQSKLTPHGLVASTTHDTKRSEDARARLNVLSEMPVRWYRSIKRWQAYNKHWKAQVNGAETPDANEEYLIYQALVATWPFDPMDAAAREAYLGRIQAYVLKALKEAKLHTSWISPNADYEKAVSDFVTGILTPASNNRFLTDFSSFEETIARAGLFNSLSQTLLKITMPGVPDFYQGSEIWDFRLVDPDNRGPVDYDLRRRMLGALKRMPPSETLVRKLLAAPEDGRIKLHLIARALEFRRSNPGLFAFGGYQPLSVAGPRRRNVCAFARRHEGKEIVVAVGRFFAGLEGGVASGWKGTVVRLRSGGRRSSYRDIITGRSVSAVQRNGKWELPVDAAFGPLPAVFLERVE